MKTYQNEPKWIWESQNFPNFTYQHINLDALNYKFGQLKMVENFINKNSSDELRLELLLDEAIATCAIEGEILQRSSVHSSINKILKLGLEDDYSYTVQSDNLIQILLDAKTNLIPLTKERLFSWHKALFEVGSSGLREIIIGEYRKDKEDMQIVSGSWEKEKVHYIAPPSQDMENLMEKFLIWLNNSESQNNIYKAIIAHLYFVLIHPFDDGNGRTVRILFTYLLKFYGYDMFYYISLSEIINRKKAKEYYQAFLDVERSDINDKNSFDLTYFFYYMTNVMLEGLKLLKHRINTHLREDIIKNMAIKNNIDLTPRQEKIIKILSNKNNTFMITSEELSKNFDVAVRTIQKDLKLLIDFDLIEKIKAPKNKKKNYFRLNIDL